MARIREDHALTAATIEDTAYTKTGHAFGVSWRQGFRTGFWQAVEYVLTLQQQYDDLTNAEVIDELRKGPESLYWPLKSADPKAWLLCDRCRTRQLFDAQGVCPNCAEEVNPA
jgi:uncharacterized paraquat-inducible protein A